MQNVILRHGDQLKFGVYSTSFVFEDIELTRSESDKQTTGDTSQNAVHSTTETAERPIEPTPITVDQTINNINHLVGHLMEEKNASDLEKLKKSLEQCLQGLSKTSREQNGGGNEMSNDIDDLEAELSQIHSNTGIANQVDVTSKLNSSCPVSENVSNVQPQALISSNLLPRPVNKALPPTQRLKSPAHEPKTSSSLVNNRPVISKLLALAENTDPLAVSDADPFASIPDKYVVPLESTDHKKVLSSKKTVQLPQSKLKIVDELPKLCTSNSKRAPRVINSMVTPDLKPKRVGRPRQIAQQVDTKPEAGTKRKSISTNSDDEMSLNEWATKQKKQKKSGSSTKVETPVTQDTLVPKKRRGRPPKDKETAVILASTTHNDVKQNLTVPTNLESVKPTKSKRKNQKNLLPESNSSEAAVQSTSTIPKRRGRPPKQSSEAAFSANRSPLKLVIKKNEARTGKTAEDDSFVARNSINNQADASGQTKQRQRKPPKKLLDDDYEADLAFEIPVTKKSKSKTGLTEPIPEKKRLGRPKSVTKRLTEEAHRNKLLSQLALSKEQHKQLVEYKAVVTIKRIDPI